MKHEWYDCESPSWLEHSKILKQSRALVPRKIRRKTANTQQFLDSWRSRSLGGSCHFLSSHSHDSNYLDVRSKLKWLNVTHEEYKRNQPMNKVRNWWPKFMQDASWASFEILKMRGVLPQPVTASHDSFLLFSWKQQKKTKKSQLIVLLMSI